MTTSSGTRPLAGQRGDEAAENAMLAAARRLCNAWICGGQHYRYHEELRKRLERDWPAMHSAIIDVVTSIPREVSSENPTLPNGEV